MMYTFSLVVILVLVESRIIVCTLLNMYSNAFSPQFTSERNRVIMYNIHILITGCEFSNQKALIHFL